MSTKRWANYVALYFVQSVSNSIIDLPFKKDKYYRTTMKELNEYITSKMEDYPAEECSSTTAGAIAKHVTKEWILAFEYKREFIKSLELPSKTRINLDFTYKTILKSLYRKQRVCKRQARTPKAKVQ